MPYLAQITRQCHCRRRHIKDTTGVSVGLDGLSGAPEFVQHHAP